MIKTKKEYYENTFNFRCGNHLKCWKTIKDLFDDKYDGFVSARNTKLNGNVIPKKKRIYYAKKENLIKIISGFGYNINDYIFFEGPLDKERTLQGEITYTDKLYLHYTFSKVPLGIALNSVKYKKFNATNLSAKLILKKYCDEKSYDTILDLLDYYTDITNTLVPVIEFTCFNKSVGVFSTNTIIWEVRNY
ncbi:MAG: hypothetical protein BV456_00695 [Thermoplasmata archaeon M8B2D]|nr:MAG: hypothetical protein BV456_00695 [Thermoplasmata archaeon M8B2D]